MWEVEGRAKVISAGETNVWKIQDPNHNYFRKSGRSVTLNGERKRGDIRIRSHSFDVDRLVLSHKKFVYKKKYDIFLFHANVNEDVTSVIMGFFLNFLRSNHYFQGLTDEFRFGMQNFLGPLKI